MKVLVTGGTGFIGLNLSIYLAKNGAQVTICDNNFRGKLDEDAKHAVDECGLKFLKCDLTNKDDFQNLDKDYDEIYHLAAVNGTENFYKMPEKVLRVNTLAVINLLDWVVDNDIKSKILFSSSSETYATTRNKKIPTPETVDLTIDDVHNPRFSYAGSKIIGELFFLNYAKKYDLDTKIVRYHNIYGPRMGYEHVMPQFSVRILKKESPFKIYGGENTRAFCYIDDAVEATISVMRCDEAKNQIVNIGNEKEEVKILDLAKKMLNFSDYDVKIEIEDAPSGSVSRRCPDISKLRELIGYYPKV
tara:strand:+ start:1382 stop:2290 length:909 start_codon:yes stop_codon:yes gene_type:complete